MPIPLGLEKARDGLGAKALQMKTYTVFTKDKPQTHIQKFDKNRNAPIQLLKYNFNTDDSGDSPKVGVLSKDNSHLGTVTIMVHHDDSSPSVSLHIHAAKGIGGKGMGSDAQQQVIEYIYKQNLIPKGYAVEMVLAGGAALKMQMAHLSSILGDKEGVELANKATEKRKEVTRKKAQAKEEGLKKFNMLFWEEHVFHLKSLAMAKVTNPKLEFKKQLN